MLLGGRQIEVKINDNIALHGEFFNKINESKNSLEGKLEATKFHLDDMRKLVFDK